MYVEKGKKKKERKKGKKGEGSKKPEYSYRGEIFE